MLGAVEIVPLGTARRILISHWMAFLLLSVYFGGLAAQVDCRRVIQSAQVLFMSLSAMWGILFVTETLE